MEEYDIALVCMNGHMVNDRSHSKPQFNEKHCSKCGAQTIANCPNCNEPIKGDYLGGAVVVGIDTPAPTYCHTCGGAYPWKKTVEKVRKEKRVPNQSLLDKIKGNAVWVSIVGAMCAVAWLGNWWKDLPDEWRDWLVKRIPTVQINWP